MSAFHLCSFHEIGAYFLRTIFSFILFVLKRINSTEIIIIYKLFNRLFGV